MCAILFAFSFAAVKNLRADQMHSLKQIGFIYFVYLFIYSGLEYTVTFLMYHNFGYTSIDQAKMYVTTGVVMAFLQGGVVRRLPAHLNQQSAVFGLFLIVPSFILIGMAKDTKMVYAGMILFAVCMFGRHKSIVHNSNLIFCFLMCIAATAFVVTCMTTLISRYGNHDQKGTVLGIFRSLGALARAIGPIVASIGELNSCT